MARSPIAAYVVLAFGITWIYLLVLLRALRLPFMPWAIPGSFGPALAAVLVTWAVGGRAGVRVYLARWVRWRVGVRWYLFGGVLLPLVMVAGSAWLPHGSDGVAGPKAALLLSYLVQVVGMTLVGGGNEEPGWRGFALPHLQRAVGPLRGTLALGVLWGLWHLPLFWLVPNYDNSGTGLASVAPMFLAFVVFTTALSIVLAWVYNHTRESILMAAFVHGSVNAGFGLVTGGRPAMLVVFAILTVLASGLAVATRGRLGWQSQAAAGAAIARPS